MADKRSVDYVVARLKDYAEVYGDRLAPAQLLRDMEPLDAASRVGSASSLRRAEHATSWA